MLMTNKNIYNYAQMLIQNFNDNSQRLPIKINFYLQKNMEMLISKAQEIEKAREELVRAYGVPSPDSETQYSIPSEKVAEFTSEINDLFALEQEIAIYSINISDIDNDISLTTGQMQAMMFMIN